LIKEKRKDKNVYRSTANRFRNQGNENFVKYFFAGERSEKKTLEKSGMCGSGRRESMINGKKHTGVEKHSKPKKDAKDRRVRPDGDCISQGGPGGKMGKETSL